MSEKNNNSIRRREFFTKTAAAALALSVGPRNVVSAEDSAFHKIPESTLPTRVFGRTGARIPILTFGCGSRWMRYEEDEGIEVINQAIDSGIIYLDSAHIYGPYLRSIPVLTVGAKKGKNGVSADGAGADDGWVYTEASGAIVANTDPNDVDDAGVAYNTY